jgi:uroporphyrinogen III methyltransferase/synthase
MGIKNLKNIKDNLIKAGKDPETRAGVVQWGTLPEQKVVTGSLKDIDVVAKAAGIKPPGIIVVGNVINLREKLNWFEKRPLFGKQIAITRPRHQSARLGSLLTERGARVIYAPTIDIEPIHPNKKLLKALGNLSAYYCIIFTSVNGVTVFFDNLFGMGMDVRALHGIKILPIGDATASLLKSYCITPDLLPERFISEGIVDVLKDLDIKGKKFLLPRAKEARDVVVDYIKSRGGMCDTIPVYKTATATTVEALTEKPDVITFTSSSTVNNFIKIYGREVLETALIASIGPITSDTLRRNGFTVHIEATKYDINGLVDAIERHLENQRNR